MNYKHGEYNGYKCVSFEFEGYDATVVFPKNPTRRKKWMFKTEYFKAFPAFQDKMLSRGYYLVNIKNETRWCLESDTDRQARFARFLQKTFGLYKKCVTVGMSCGGMQSLFLAARYPGLVAVQYLDAPVVNYLSCPCAVGDAVYNEKMYNEFVAATGLTVSDLIIRRNNPQDVLECFKRYRIPVILVAGDSDTVVPYHENGKAVEDFYKSHRLPIEVHIKEGCDHHPHSLDDVTPIIDFIEKYY